jgi:hypothetical protein
MTDIRSLEQTLLDNLLQNKARIKFVARFLLALVSLRQNSVGTGFVMADAILPKGHRDTKQRRLSPFSYWHHDPSESKSIVKTFSDLHRFLHKLRHIKAHRQPSTFVLNNLTRNNISDGECLAYREPLLSRHEKRCKKLISCSGAIYRFNLPCW